MSYNHSLDVNELPDAKLVQLAAVATLLDSTEEQARVNES
jgi:hypothetical protein